MSASNGKTCSTCFFFTKFEKNGVNGDHCRRYPPTRSWNHLNNKFTSGFPGVWKAEANWCGEWVADADPTETVVNLTEMVKALANDNEGGD